MTKNNSPKTSHMLGMLTLVALLLIGGRWLTNDVPVARAGVAGLAGDVPVGTIVAYLGYEAPAGWLLCDGGKIPLETEYLGLVDLLGVTRTPDLRGCFLRGLDNAMMVRNDEVTPPKYDPDWETRVLGDVQIDATALPNNPYVIGEGKHSHHISRHVCCDGGDASWMHNDGGYRGQIMHNGINTETDGAHSHSISGGDIETRPTNVAVNYIIKY